MIKITHSIKTHNNIYNPELKEFEGWRHYALTLESERTSMMFNFSTTHRNAVLVEEVIEHLQGLADTVEAFPESIEDWAAEYGLDHHLPTTHKKYAWAQSIAKDFRRLQEKRLA